MSEITYQRVTLACEQLDVAIDLFLTKRSLAAALTLAGAAEEILGKALSLKACQNALEYKYNVIKQLGDAVPGGSLNRKAFTTEENYARNALKHLNSLAENTITIDLHEAALWMLVRARANYRELDYPATDRMTAFDNWFYEHIIGV